MSRPFKPGSEKSKEGDQKREQRWKNPLPAGSVPCVPTATMSYIVAHENIVNAVDADFSLISRQRQPYPKCKNEDDEKDDDLRSIGH